MNGRSEPEDRVLQRGWTQPSWIEHSQPPERELDAQATPPPPACTDENAPAATGANVQLTLPLGDSDNGED